MTFRSGSRASSAKSRSPRGSSGSIPTRTRWKSFGKRFSGFAGKTRERPMEVNVSTQLPSLDAYKPVVGPQVIDDLRLLADHLKGQSIQHVNSTASGGGVAEI